MFGGHWIDQGRWRSWRGCRSDSGSQLHDLVPSGVDAMCMGGGVLVGILEVMLSVLKA